MVVPKYKHLYWSDFYEIQAMHLRKGVSASSLMNQNTHPNWHAPIMLIIGLKKNAQCQVHLKVTREENSATLLTTLLFSNLYMNSPRNPFNCERLFIERQCVRNFELYLKVGMRKILVNICLPPVPVMIFFFSRTIYLHGVWKYNVVTQYTPYPCRFLL